MENEDQKQTVTSFRLLWSCLGLITLLFSMFRVSFPDMKEFERIWQEMEVTTAARSTASRSETSLPPSDRLANWPELQDWEIESMVNGTCHPPAHIPKQCCIGSISRGGGMVFQERGSCYKNASEYMDAENLALSLLSSLDQYSGINPTQQQCDVCRILDVLTTNNWTISFVGDSMMRQTYAALQCEFHRRGYNVSEVEKHPTNMKSAKWRYAMSDFMTFQVFQDSKRSMENRLATSDEKIAGTFVLFPIYRPNPDAVPLIANKSDIVIFDHGLHYLENEREKFESEILNFASTMQEYDPTIPLLWRQTSSQHFNSSGGYFDKSVMDKSKRQCVPHGDKKHIDFHHEAIEKVFQKLRNQNFSHQTGVIPFREYTSHFVQLRAFQTGDCTHFCHLPSFWLYLWRQLRLELDQIAINMNNRP